MHEIQLNSRLNEEDWKKKIITPRVAAAGIVESFDKQSILIIKRKYPPLGLAFPGGMIDLGETVEEAIVREVLEETGVHARSKGLLSVLSSPKYDPRWHVVVFYVVLETDAFQDAVAADDAAEAFWFDVDSITLQEGGVQSSRVVLEKYKIWRKEKFKLLKLE